jgi:hypothetical protein
MSDEYAYHSPEARAAALAVAFVELSPEDQALVMALIARLRGPVEEEEFPPDVKFMDFDQ